MRSPPSSPVSPLPTLSKNQNSNTTGLGKSVGSYAYGSKANSTHHDKKLLSESDDEVSFVEIVMLVLAAALTYIRFWYQMPTQTQTQYSDDDDRESSMSKTREIQSKFVSFMKSKQGAVMLGILWFVTIANLVNC